MITKPTKTIFAIADWDIKNLVAASGYSNIAAPVCTELANRGYGIIASGFSYNYQEHYYPFGINRVPLNNLPSALHSMLTGIQLENILVFGDIPLQLHLAEIIQRPKEVKYTGVFAVEADPLSSNWAMGLYKMDERFTISEFGKQECAKVGVKSEHLLVPIDTKLWPKRTLHEKQELKDKMGVGHKKVLFLNADNNERKNIAALFEAMALIIKIDPNVHLFLLTRKESPVGWNFADLVQRLKIQRNVTVLNRGLALQEIRDLYAMSDFYVNLTKSEGLGLGILEAQAVGTPVIATNATAMIENCNDGKGILCDYDHVYLDPFGNANRYLVFPETMAKCILDNIQNMEKDPEYYNAMTEKAYTKILTRTASYAADQIEKVLK